MTSWKISHVFKLGVPYQSGPRSYPRLGIDLVGDGASITGIDHVIDVDDRFSKPEVLDLSTREISLLIELIRFRSGYCDLASQSISPRAATSGTRPSATTWTYITGNSAIQQPLQSPTEASLASAPPRLRVWLRLAADAMTMSSPDAIRNYYMIWEDMGIPSPVGSAGEELKFIRHFVSHGGTLTKPALLAFLQREFRKPVSLYDPHDTDHVVFLDGRRGWARNLVEAEINRLL
jgi:hypothetical protein